MYCDMMCFLRLIDRCFRKDVFFSITSACNVTKETRSSREDTLLKLSSALDSFNIRFYGLNKPCTCNRGVTDVLIWTGVFFQSSLYTRRYVIQRQKLVCPNTLEINSIESNLRNIYSHNSTEPGYIKITKRGSR